MCAHQGQDNQAREIQPTVEDCADSLSFTKLRDPCVYGIHHWGRRIHAASPRYLHFHPPTHYRRHIANLLRGKFKKKKKRTVSLRLSSTYDAHVLSSWKNVFEKVSRKGEEEEEKKNLRETNTEMTDVKRDKRNVSFDIYLGDRQRE